MGQRIRGLFLVLAWIGTAAAWLPARTVARRPLVASPVRVFVQHRPCTRLLLSNPLDDSDDNDELIVRGSVQDDLPEEVWQEIEQGKPSEWLVMKQVRPQTCYDSWKHSKAYSHVLFRQLLGINVFTYILAALIVFFLGMNLVLGPGWLGSTIGVSGVGETQKISDSLPDLVDLSQPDFRL